MNILFSKCNYEDSLGHRCSGVKVLSKKMLTHHSIKRDNNVGFSNL